MARSMLGRRAIAYARWLVRGIGMPRQTLMALTLIWALIAGLIVVIPVLWLAPKTAAPYVLTTADRALLGPGDSKLSSMITYDAKNQEYVFNGAGKSTSAPPKPKPGEISHSDTLNATPYSADLPVDPANGFTYYENNLQLSFKIIPQFSMLPAQQIDGRIVYGIPSGGYVVYSAEGNGLREDVVFDRPVGDQTFAYQLALPNTLEARTMGGGGDIGIYSADASLFGHISFGSSQDQLDVMDARVSSPKNNLVFGFPAPFIRQSTGLPKRFGRRVGLSGRQSIRRLRESPQRSALSNIG